MGGGGLGVFQVLMFECQKIMSDQVNLKGFALFLVGIWHYNGREVSYCSKSLCETFKEDQRRSAAC